MTLMTTFHFDVLWYNFYLKIYCSITSTQPACSRPRLPWMVEGLSTLSTSWTQSDEPFTGADAFSSTVVALVRVASRDTGPSFDVLIYCYWFNKGGWEYLFTSSEHLILLFGALNLPYCWHERYAHITSKPSTHTINLSYITAGCFSETLFWFWGW